MIYKISEISRILNAQLISKEDCEIQHILIDSRNVISTQNTLFFAIKGDRHDGHKFIVDAHIDQICHHLIHLNAPHHAAHRLPKG